jgi:hypothetical protein
MPDTILDAHVIGHLPPRLQVLSVNKISFRNKAEQYLSQKLPISLWSLQLCGLNEVNDNFLLNIPRGLHTLLIGNNDTITDNGIHVIPLCLRQLEIQNNSKIGATVLKYLPNTLKVLRLINCSKLKNINVEDLPQNLEILDLGWDKTHLVLSYKKLRRKSPLMEKICACILPMAKL